MMNIILRIREASAAKFNRVCLVIALLWLSLSVPLGILWRPTVTDFSQFYMGGLLARHGEWKSLYPIPMKFGVDNPGLYVHSWVKQGWTRYSLKYGVPDYTRFILPPPSALLFIPLTFVSYPTAFWIWIIFLTACVFGVAINAGRLHRTITGEPSKTEGILALLIVLSPMTARSIRIANVSPPVAFLLSVTILALVDPNRRTAFRGAAALILGALLKYATLILAPLLLAMRQWRMILWSLLLGWMTLALTVLASGIEPFVEFYKVILPTLSRPSWYYGNQSLPGLLARMYGRPFPYKLTFSLFEARALSFEIIILVLLTTPRQSWKDPTRVMAAVALLISWLLIFSPIAWEHWPVFLCPIWGWMIWEARQSLIRRFMAISSLVLLYLPAGIIQVHGIATYPVILPEPFNSSQLIGTTLLMILSFWRVADRREPVPVHQLNAFERYSTTQEGIIEKDY